MLRLTLGGCDAPSRGEGRARPGSAGPFRLPSGRQRARNPLAAHHQAIMFVEVIAVCVMRCLGEVEARERSKKRR